MADLQITCRVLLFDMDGVLVDSTPAVTRVWSRWAREHGFDPEHVAHIAHGRPSITTIRELLPDADHEAENKIVESREIEDTEGIAACPGAPDLLASLPSESWVLVTSSTRALAHARLRAGGYATPKLVVTSSDITHGKPHPEPFLKGVAMAGVAASGCIVVEDTPVGIQAGKAAGCRVLALRTTMAEDLLEAARPDWIADSLASVRLVEASADGELRLALKGVKVLTAV